MVAFSWFLTEEPAGGCTEVQKTWQTWAFEDFGQKNSGQHGRGHIVKPRQARAFAAAELAPSMTLKSYWVQKPKTLKVICIISPEFGEQTLKKDTVCKNPRI